MTLENHRNGRVKVLRPTRAIVDLSAISHNIRSLRAAAGPRVLHMAVVKADGYGHGAVAVAKASLSSGAEWLGVALVEEGMEIRRARITAPILVLGSITPQSAEEAIAHNLAVSVSTRQVALALNHIAGINGRKASIHVKVDTGMGRIGINPDEVIPFLEWLFQLKHISVEGIFSHFARADEVDKSFAIHQLSKFQKVIESLEAQGIAIPIKHIANTAAAMNLPKSHLDMIRTGIGIYGLYPSKEMNCSIKLKPAMALSTEIIHLKEVPEETPVSYGATYVTKRKSQIATLPVGYGDGYPHLLSNRGEVLVHGKKAPIVGSVCMDMIMIDVTDISQAKLGDEVMLFGRQQGGEISVDDIAKKAETINYEIVCNITKRVPRIYQ